MMLRGVSRNPSTQDDEIDSLRTSVAYRMGCGRSRKRCAIRAITAAASETASSATEPTSRDICSSSGAGKYRR